MVTCGDAADGKRGIKDWRSLWKEDTSCQWVLIFLKIIPFLNNYIVELLRFMISQCFDLLSPCSYTFKGGGGGESFVT